MTRLLRYHCTFSDAHIKCCNLTMHCRDEAHDLGKKQNAETVHEVNEHEITDAAPTLLLKKMNQHHYCTAV